jgi:hypothetical protein
MVNFEQKKHSAEEYFQLISDLTPQELKVARSLYKAPLFLLEDAWEPWRDKVRHKNSVDEFDLSMILSRISAFGLIEPVLARVDGDDLIHFSRGEANHKATQSFEKLMKILELE